jgi:hypothetical protein
MAKRFSTYYNRQASGKYFLQIVGIQTTNPNKRQNGNNRNGAFPLWALVHLTLTYALDLEVDLCP